MNTDDPCSPSDFGELSEAERLALELRWYEGQMLRYAEWIFTFVDRHRVEILRAASDSQNPAALLAATKQIIARRGSIHIGAELKAQMREIENELWYRGEKGDYDRASIQLEWTTQHAAAWRHWRIREYLFAVDHCAGRVVAILHAPPHDPLAPPPG